MTESILLVLFLISFLLAIYKYIKSSLVMAILTVSFLALVGTGLVPSLMAKKLDMVNSIYTNHPWDHRNAIIVLGGGTVKTLIADTLKPTTLSYSRIYEGMRLYLLCKKAGHICKLILSGGDAYGNGQPEADIYKKAFVDLNVKPTDILTEKTSMNTFENAKFTSELIQQEGFDKVYLVTSGLHIHRALLYFKNFGIEAEPASSDYLPAKMSIIPISYNFVLADLMTHEYLGIIRYKLYNHFGWNHH